jgi:hypothetical protein
MLIWHNELWLIDHGASLYFHHNWNGWETHALKPFIQVKDHVLLPFASELKQADKELKERLTDTVIEAILKPLPDEWLQEVADQPPVSVRETYNKYLQLRLAQSDQFVNEALHARAQLI